jgi:hypothetical protein
MLGGILIALVGCNTLVSRKPMFDQDENERTSALKPGIWQAVSPACEASHKRMCTLPPLAIGAAGIRIPGELLAKLPPTTGGCDILRQEQPYIIVAGDPILIQLQVTGCSSAGPTETHYFFIAMQPSEKDAEGKISAGYVWPVMCGPFPKPGEWNYDMNDDERYITNHPFPELRTDTHEGCAPKSKASLRVAARKSRDVIGSYLARWIADEKR